VYKAWDSNRKEQVAIKIHRHTKAKDDKIFKYEQFIISQIQTKTHSIVFPFFSRSDTAMSVVIMPLGADLARVSKKVGPMDEPCVRLIALDLLQCLQEMHTAGFAHRDIKPSNALLFKNGHCSLSDFNFCLSLSENVPRFPANKDIAPPECTGDSSYDLVKADVWYLGITLLGMFDEATGFSDACGAFLLPMMESDPQKRPLLSELLQHRWLRQDSKDERVARLLLVGIWYSLCQ